MTNDELNSYYSNLLLIQFSDKPKAVAFIKAMAAAFTLGQLPSQIQNAFQIGLNAANPNNPQAIGGQLDILAKYVGVKRTGVGVNQQTITLGDSDFTKLIQMGIVTNNNNSDLATIDNFLQTYFPNQIFVYDNENMTLNYLVTGALGGLDLIQMFITQNLLPQPMGVEIAAIAYVSSISLFGMVSYNNVPGNYNGGTTYSLGQQVLASSGIVYQSLVAGNIGNAVTNTNFWIPLIYPMNTYATYPTFEPYTWFSYLDTIVV